MTCEVLCMNAHGLAIAVDSAVSLGSNGKAYPSAEKLFAVGNGAPVAIATYGNAQFCEVPWKLVIETWNHTLGNRRFATLDEYAQNFSSFLAQDHPLFTVEREAISVTGCVQKYLYGLANPVLTEWGFDTRAWGEEAWNALREHLSEDAKTWTCGFMPGFDDAHGSNVIEAYAEQLDNVRADFFDGELPPEDVWAQVMRIVHNLYTQAWISPDSASGIVLLGYGEGEYFPSYINLSIGARALNRVHWLEEGRGRITHENSGVVKAFAQPDMVDAFILGMPHRAINPLKREVYAGMQRLLSESEIPEETMQSMNLVDAAEATANAFVDVLRQQFQQPLMTAVSALPTRELSTFARAAVNLAAFRSQLAADQTGTVGGEIRVAEITKYGGLVWR